MLTDIGIRCDRHVGEVFPPRCPTCESLAKEWRAITPVDYDAPVNCSIEEPCDQCKATQEGNDP